MIVTCSKVERKYSGNDRECSYERRTVFGEFSKIFGNLRTMLGNLLEIAKTFILLFIYTCIMKFFQYLSEFSRAD